MECARILGVPFGWLVYGDADDRLDRELELLFYSVRALSPHQRASVAAFVRYLEEEARRVAGVS
jgi:hypothetical protein